MASSATPLAASAGESPWFVATFATNHMTGDKSLISNLEPGAGESPWFVATFATNHMTGDKSLISNLEPVSNQVIKAGVGEGMHVCGRGYVNTGTVVLPDVWYVPGFTMNQVSVGQLTHDPDLIVEIGGGKCLISKKSDGSVLGKARLRSDHKYVVDFLKIELN